GTGPGAGMSLLILLAAIIGIIVPAISYAIPAFRNVEDIIPDNDFVSSQASKSRETVRAESKESMPRPLIK
ncbi:MAG TPA: hypothetical protein VKE92_04285, partial [Anaerolineales bacterium]|nr:hypothetical protein [Anaerolineales bacterium]